MLCQSSSRRLPNETTLTRAHAGSENHTLSLKPKSHAQPSQDNFTAPRQSPLETQLTPSNLERILQRRRRQLRPPVRFFFTAIGLWGTAVLCGCGGAASDQASSGASTDEIKAFIDANPSFAEIREDAATAKRGSETLAGQQSSGAAEGQASQPLDLGN
jgi:hypothetical protein